MYLYFYITIGITCALNGMIAILVLFHTRIKCLSKAQEKLNAFTPPSKMCIHLFYTISYNSHYLRYQTIQNIAVSWLWYWLETLHNTSPEQLKGITRMCRYQITRDYKITAEAKSLTTRLIGKTWGQPGSCRPQVGPMLASWTLLSGVTFYPVVSDRTRIGDKSRLVRFSDSSSVSIKECG